MLRTSNNSVANKSTLELLLLHKIFETGDLVIFDGGFYIGTFSEWILNIYENCKIFAFEPNRSIKNLCPPKIQQLINNKGIELVNKALTETNGFATYNISEVSPTNSLLKRPSSGFKYYPFKAEFSRSETVETISIDTFCELKNIKHIHLLKLDLQGGEINAIKGAKKILEKNSIDIVYAECCFVQKYENQPLLNNIWNLLEGFDYKLFSIENITVGACGNSTSQMLSRRFNQANAIFISAKLNYELELDYNKYLNKTLKSL